MFVTADQLVAHAVGDYLLQSHWMATEKTSRSIAALAHGATYMLPFLFLTRDPRALAIIVGTHFVIDRWRLARYVVWAKNQLAPPYRIYGGWVAGGDPWRLSDETGYPSDTPAWLAVWLLIVSDNIMHVVCNAAALHWFP